MPHHTGKLLFSIQTIRFDLLSAINLTSVNIGVDVISAEETPVFVAATNIQTIAVDYFTIEPTETMFILSYKGESAP